MATSGNSHTPKVKPMVTGNEEEQFFVLLLDELLEVGHSINNRLDNIHNYIQCLGISEWAVSGFDFDFLL